MTSTTTTTLLNMLLALKKAIVGEPSPVSVPPNSPHSSSGVLSAEDKEQLSRALHIYSGPLFTFRLLPFSPKEEGRVTREEVVGVKGAFLLHNVLSRSECETLISDSESLGYTEAPISTGLNTAVLLKDVRDNNRVMWTADAGTLEEITSRVAKFLPQEVTIRTSAEDWELIPGKEALNERFRFYRYALGERFQPHYDGSFPRSVDERSLLTFIIYLNGDLEGGETTFFRASCVWQKESPIPEVRVNPRAGSALVFHHTGELSPLHEGSPHFSEGKFKYAMRSDVMYRRKSAK